MKYVVYENEGMEHVITFSGERTEKNHKELTDALGLKKIVAAGFFMEIAGNKFFTGESASLGIGSRGDVDKELYIEQCRRG
ncbi:hypothetical protein KAR91_76065 [Candidatus Pacearchaeota archaeon]|nr:hypothetical protein [Candidatus Pacearchaeota archaeon]